MGKPFDVSKISRSKRQADLNETPYAPVETGDTCTVESPTGEQRTVSLINANDLVQHHHFRMVS